MGIATEWRGLQFSETAEVGQDEFEVENPECQAETLEKLGNRDDNFRKEFAGERLVRGVIASATPKAFNTPS